MAYSLLRAALILALALGACPEPCPEDQQPAPICAPVDRGTIALPNSSFELPDPLAGWSLADAPDVAATLIPGIDGCTAVSLARRDGDPLAPAARYTTTLDATALRGQRVRLSLWARVDRDEKKAHPTLALRASIGKRQVLLDMRTARIKGQGWRLHTLEFDLPADSDRLHLVVGLGGARRLDLDGVVLDRIGPACPGCDPPAPLSEHDLENLSALTNLFGHVRYFYPGPEAQYVDWDRLALAGVQAVLAADGPTELAAALGRVFRPIAPRLQLSAHALPPPAPDGPAGPLVVVRGNNGSTSALFPRADLLAALPPGVAIPDLGDAATFELPGGVHVRFPLAVAATADEFWRVDNPDHLIPLDKPPGFTLDLDDRPTRLAAIVALTARLKHFSARLDPALFDSVLADSLRRAATARDRYELRAVVFRIYAAIGEGAAVAGFSDGDVGLSYSLPIGWTWLDGQLVITSVDERTPDLHRGDVVVAIDGRASEAVLADWRELSWGATEARRMAIAASLARRSTGAPIDLQIRRPDGSERRVKVRFAHHNLGPRDEPSAAIVDLEGGLLHIKLGEATAADLRAASMRIAEARGVIFSLTGDLAPGVEALFRATLGDLGGPAPRHLTWPDGQPLTPNAAPPQLPAGTAFLPLPPRIAVLINPNTQGDGEALADALRHHRGALLVGRPTVGAPDKPAKFELPDGLFLWFSETPYRYASGHPSFAPLQPDILAAPTRESIVEGRDPALDAAAAALRATR